MLRNQENHEEPRMPSLPSFQGTPNVFTTTPIMTPIYPSPPQFYPEPPFQFDIPVTYTSPFSPLYSPFMAGMGIAGSPTVHPSMTPVSPLTPVNVVYTNDYLRAEPIQLGGGMDNFDLGSRRRNSRSMNDCAPLPDPSALKLSKGKSSTLLEVMDENPQGMSPHPQPMPHNLPILTKGQSGQYVSFACDRKQSLKLQKIIADAKAQRNFDIIESMYCQFLPEVLRLARDQFANFVLQRFVEALRIDLVDSLAENIKRDAVAMATNQFACRVLQSILTHCSPKLHDELTAVLLPDAQELLRDNYGCYVLQRIIQTKPSNQLNKFMVEHIIPHYFDLSVHQYGGRVIQDIFRYFHPEDKTDLTNCVLRGILALCKDSYGNYVVQKMIHYGDVTVRGRIVDALLPHVPELCCNKAGSNILEKCLSKATAQQKITLMGPIVENQTNLKRIVCDKYGNYVLQRMLVSLPYQKRQHLFDALNNYFAECNLENLNTYERYVYEQIMKISNNN